MSDPDLDELGLAMPEFRVPSRGGETASDESDRDDDFEDEPTNITEVPDEPTHNVVVDDLLRDDAAQAEAEKFDRAELVKTVRMDAFDRGAVERGDAPAWEITQELQDQRYAPDVLILPPRVLTRRWQDGAGTGQVVSQTEAAPSNEPQDRGQLDTVRTTPLPAPESEPELDIDSEAIELDEIVSEAKPPPRPAAERRPGRAKQNTAPLQQSERSVPPQAEGDDDMSGIVQELLEEKKKPEPKRKAGPKINDKRVNWFKDVFSDEYFRTLPKDLSDQTEREVRFIHKMLGMQKGARILDLGCGFGRHTIELAQRDYAVAGLDASISMLQKALAETQRRGLKIKFVHGDMRELNFNSMFDAVFSWQTSFGYFDDRTNVQVAQGIARALKPGGRFLIDVVNRDHIVSEMPSRTWWEGHECVFLEEVEFDNNFSVLHTKRSFIYENGAAPQEFSSYIRLYSLHELRQLLHFAGFRVLEVSGSIHYPGSYLGPSSPRIILLAEKVAKEG